MKGAMQSFIAESSIGAVTSTPATVKEQSTSNSALKTSDGSLLLAGCNDWDNSTAKAPAGLADIHCVQLGSPVSRLFSSSSSMHEFAILSDGRILAMGRNDRGQLGTGDTNRRDLYVLIAMPSSSPVVKISTGRSHSLFLLENGEVWGCGANNFGQLGLGSSKAVAKDVLSISRISFSGDRTLIRDIACGYDFSLFCTTAGRLYACGHPEYGVMGQGTDGQFIKDGGKGPAVQFSCEYTPALIDRFVTKDHHNKVTATRTGAQVKIRAVAAGKNHCVCLEEWEPNTSTSTNNSADTAEDPLNRVFSWGWGGYGRLGHNSANDEFFPREVMAFSQSIVSPTDPSVRIPILPTMRQKLARELVCGAAYTLVVSETRNLYYFGKMSNAPRGEATMHPQMQQELFDYPVRHCAAGSNLVVVVAGVNNRAKGINGATDGPCITIAWGMPVSGKIGFEGNAKSSTNPKILTRLDGLDIHSVACGYGHVSFVAQNSTQEGSPADALSTFPVLDATPSAPSASAGAGKKKGASASGPASKKSKK